MTKEEQIKLEQRLAGLDSNERNRLYKRASQMRKLSQRPKATKNRRPFFDEDDDETTLMPSRRPRSSLHEWALKLLAQDEEAETLSETRSKPSNTAKGTVIAVGYRSAEVVVDGKALTCILEPELAKRQQTEIAVGDEVEVAIKNENVARVEAVLPRRSKLSRPDPGKPAQERVIVANVDVVGIVVSVVSPPLHPRLIDRYLVAIARGGAQAILCVNKIDLLEEGPALDVLRPYEALGLPIVRASATAGTGRETLFELLKGKLSAFVGHSGVGKSSLLNLLRPDLGLRVGEVSEGYGRGTHTTTSSTLWDLGENTRVIDTPGVRSFGLWNLAREELPYFFPEFSKVGPCRFRDCSHIHEPGCAVRSALEEGSISKDRFETYLRILATL